MGLSLAGIPVMFGILGPLFIILLLAILINVLQAKKPEWLPTILRNWNFLPLWMHSLDPLDKLLRTIGSACCCCCGDGGMTSDGLFFCIDPAPVLREPGFLGGGESS